MDNVKGNISKRKGLLSEIDDPKLERITQAVTETLSGRIYNPDNKAELGQITQEKIDTWDSKVDAEEGKMLSSNDFTNKYISKILNNEAELDVHSKNSQIHLSAAQHKLIQDYSLKVNKNNSDTYAASYDIVQKGAVVGTINIPKDMVISSGEVVTYTDENKPAEVGVAGTYVVLTIANAKKDKLYINASELLKADAISEIENNVKAIQNGMNSLGFDITVTSTVALYNEVDITPSPAEWFVFDEETGAITQLNPDMSSEITAATELIIPWKINGVKVEAVGNDEGEPIYRGNGGVNELNVQKIETVRFPNSISKICPFAFSEFKGLKSINIPTSLVEIGAYAFNNCSDLHEAITPVKPNWEMIIGFAAFNGCEALNNIDSIIDGVKTIPEYAFANCGVKNVVIPESVNRIQLCAFNAGQINMCTILNPDCVIEPAAFGGMPGDVKYIKGYKGSTAEQYASTKNCTFVSLEGGAGSGGDVDLSNYYTKDEVDERFGYPINAEEVAM